MPEITPRPEAQPCTRSAPQGPGPLTFHPFPSPPPCLTASQSTCPSLICRSGGGGGENQGIQAPLSKLPAAVNLSPPHPLEGCIRFWRNFSSHQLLAKGTLLCPGKQGTVHPGCPVLEGPTPRAMPAPGAAKRPKPKAASERGRDSAWNLEQPLSLLPVHRLAGTCLLRPVGRASVCSCSNLVPPSPSPDPRPPHTHTHTKGKPPQT